MNWFLDWFLPISALLIGVMILTVFFNLLAAVKRWLSPTRSITVKGFLGEHDRVTLHLKRGEIFENVRFIGFTDVTSAKHGIPYSLQNLAIVESLSGEHTLFRADDILSIRILKGGPNGVPRADPEGVTVHSPG